MRLMSVIYLVCILFCASCGKHAKLTVPKKLTGLNGEALYWFGVSGKPIKVLKAEYQKEIDFTVFLDRDTVALGTNLSGSIIVVKTKFKAVLDMPVSDEYERKTVDSGGRWEFSYPQNTEGIFDLKGHIEYDSLVIPFNYKYIVISKSR